MEESSSTHNCTSYSVWLRTLLYIYNNQNFIDIFIIWDLLIEVSIMTNLDQFY